MVNRDRVDGESEAKTRSRADVSERDQKKGESKVGQRETPMCEGALRGSLSPGECMHLSEQR